MKTLNRIIELAQSSSSKRIVMPEGCAKRIIEAAVILKKKGIADPILLGNCDAIQSEANSLGASLDGIELINPNASEWLDELSTTLQSLKTCRAIKGMTSVQIKAKSAEPLWFANLMVNAGYADGCVSGSVYSTADVVRTARQVIGSRSKGKTVSSFFLMMFCESFHKLKGDMIFSDCALVINPTAKQLAEIAIDAAHNAERIFSDEPRVAMLSFSSNGSANHEAVQKVIDATARVKQSLPDLAIDGEIQLDAAIVPEVSVRKIPDSCIQGCANVLIFPNLDAGNIGYKLAERIGGAKAIGPILQGLAKPANDLSRGCSVEDIVNTVAVTVMQASRTA